MRPSQMGSDSEVESKRAEALRRGETLLDKTKLGLRSILLLHINGIYSVEMLNDTTDNELLKLPSIGRTRLAEIREQAKQPLFDK